MEVRAQCTSIASGLLEPLGLTLSNQNNLLVAETGTTSPESGRISIVAPDGQRRTLLAGLIFDTVRDNTRIAEIHSPRSD